MKIFISTAKTDADIAEKLYRDLKIAGITPCMESKDLLPGQHRDNTVRQKIRESDFFLALFSSRSVRQRGRMQKDILLALEILKEFPRDGIFIIPVRIDECEPTDEELQGLSYANLFPSYTEGLQQILRVFALQGGKTDTVATVGEVSEQDIPPVQSHRLRLSVIPEKHAPAWHFLLFTSEKISFGNLSNPQADIRIPGGLKPSHARVERQSDRFFLIPEKGKCAVCGQAVGKQELVSGDEILLGNTLLLKVSRIADGNLVLALEEDNPLEYGLEAVILLKEKLQIGPEENCHIVILRLAESIELIYRERYFFIRNTQGESRIRPGYIWESDNFRLLLSEEK